MRQPAQLQLPRAIVVDAIDNVSKPTVDDARRPPIDDVFGRPAVDDVARAARGMSMSRGGELPSERGATAAITAILLSSSDK